jgi:hypothetical protein
MAGYTKLFNSILASTIWRSDDKTRLVWITMLAMADKHGAVEGSVPGLADFAHVSLEDCEGALLKLQEPDRWSRTQEHEGRRIEVIDGGWRILNHAKYRAKMNGDERREYLKVKKRESRARQQGCQQSVDKSTLSTHASPSPSPKAKAGEKRQPASLSPAAPSDPFVDSGITERAGAFIRRYRDEWYPKYRKGARYVGASEHRDYEAAVRLCQTWDDDARLEKLAACFLTTDHKFATEGSRTIPQMRAIASWLDGQLAEWEAKGRRG